MEHNFQTASFSEMTSVSSTNTIAPNFDIILEDTTNLQTYCDALIKKVFELSQTDYPTFINYQTTLVKEPTLWLNNFEELISNNEDLFTSKRSLCRYNKLFNLIEKKTNRVAIYECKRN